LNVTYFIKKITNFRQTDPEKLNRISYVKWGPTFTHCRLYI